MFWTQITPSQVPYKYRTLDSKTSIRLIKVCRTKINGEIACRIYHFDETQRPVVKYHALSYLWGDATETRQVYLRDQGAAWHPIPVHENLWLFLDYLWRHKHFKRRFWTDRICLDQKSHEEISQQVPRMHAIYRNAALVVVWLQSQEQEKEHRSLIKIARWSEILTPIPKVWEKVFEKELLSSGRNVIWNQVMRNDYWQRAWIVQEVVVANKVCVTFEDVSIDFDKLPALLERFRRPEDHRYRVSAQEPDQEPDQEPAFWSLFNMRIKGGKVPLWTILMDFEKYRSTRPADRVYGLLGMVANNDDGSSPVDNIEVDYDKPITHSLLDAALESLPPLKWYTSGFFHLFPPQDIDVGDSQLRLRDYIASSKTTQRHRDLAALSLQTLDAFEIIEILSNKVNHARINIHYLLYQYSGSETALKPTLGQSAALIGMAIAQVPKKSFISPTEPHDADGVRRYRMNLASSPSPWRCNAHRSQDGGHQGLVSNQVASTDMRRWNCESFVEACGERSHFCDGSSMIFEIPQIGFRVLFEAAINPRQTGRLSLHLEGRQDPTKEIIH